MTASADKWKHFERLVAAIHKAADHGAEVNWNDKINKRQFDVTIRFKQGLYDYLAVVECKDFATAVPVEKVEAFVTKAKDVKAHHAVMASTSGFQEGAEEVARNHNMTLIHVTDSNEIDLSVFFGAHWGTPTITPHIRSIDLHYTDGETKELPRAAHAMTYYSAHVRLRCGSEERTLRDFVQMRADSMFDGKTEEYKVHNIACPPGMSVVAPDDGEIPLKPLTSISVCAGMTLARTLTGPVMFEPYLLMPDVNVRNVATGEEQSFNPHTLRLGVNTKFEEGRFYENPQYANFWYCDRIEGVVATMYVVESFQLGQLWQAKMKIETKHADNYVPVIDAATIRRLERRLQKLKDNEAGRPKKS